MGSCIEIRLFGQLCVRRADGTLVDNASWRTGKTADLVRLLALAGGRPVRVETLVDCLWPDTEETKARASLRTAVAQIRRTLDADCILRTFDGVALTGVWTDTEAFTSLADSARAHAQDGSHAQVVRIAREAEALYVGDLDCHVSSDEVWVDQARANLSALRRDLLTDAAECALQLCWYRDAEDLARRTLQADPMAERPHRLLMSAYAGLGETERALKVYERCRRILADELGVDPSSLTKAVHLQILSGVRAPKPMSACSPATASVVSLERSLTRAGSAPGLHLVVLRGAAGSGRSEVMEAAADGISSLGWRVEHLDLRLGSRPTLSTEGDTRPLLVTLPLVDELNWNRLTQTLDTLKGQGSVPVVVVAPLNAEMLPGLGALEAAGLDLVEHEVGPMDVASLALLAEELLGSRVSGAFAERLQAASSGMFSRAVATVQAWRGEGRIVSTNMGIEVTSAFVADDRPNGSASPLRGLAAEDADLAGTLAALRLTASAPRIAAIVAEVRPMGDLATVLDGLDRLVDAAVLMVGDYGYEFRNPLIREAAESWMRPSARRQLHQQLATCHLLGPEDQAQQWALAGVAGEAVRCLLAAAELARGSRNPDRAATILDRAINYVAQGSWYPREQQETLETIAVTARRLRCPDVARRAFEWALDVAATEGLEASTRLRLEHEALSRPVLVPFTSPANGRLSGQHLRGRPVAGPPSRLAAQANGTG